MGPTTSPDGLNRYGTPDRRLPATTAGFRPHDAVDRSIADELRPGDWVMIHRQPGTPVSQSNHSMMFIAWLGGWGDDGYRNARFAHQWDNNVGGSDFSEQRVCCDARQPSYIYRVSSGSRDVNAVGPRGAAATQPATAQSAQQDGQPDAAAGAEPAREIPQVLQPIIAAHPDAVRDDAAR